MQRERSDWRDAKARLLPAFAVGLVAELILWWVEDVGGGSSSVSSLPQESAALLKDDHGALIVSELCHGELAVVAGRPWPPPARRATPAPVTATASWPAWWARPPSVPAGPTLSWASAIGASPDGAARKRAIVAVGRSILVIIWALLSDTDAQFVDLGADYYANRAKPRAQGPPARPRPAGPRLHGDPQPGRLTAASGIFGSGGLRNMGLRGHPGRCPRRWAVTWAHRCRMPVDP
jgi:hypothetical protein